ncbi:hypothetical protein HUG10_20665 (plasmid) [Halorarum halophilum]|uniref:Uncharacterized protein n=2 Tax=Halorarum halophilum TaxID=2743090 RepID=A0A7D5H090_9EURY|nr:hypothetical protein HUG10_20665 [Halobaculum halophilum]
MFRRFILWRREDESGVSGTGPVAVGVQFPDGAVAIEWLNEQNPRVDTARNGWALYPSVEGIADAEKVHGHGGRTIIVWIDAE